MNYRERKNYSRGNKTWIFHLDEESILTRECVAGISKFINNPKKCNSIGQGEIKYNAHNYGKNMLITAIDSLRTGDDLGRFRFQFSLFNKPLFGMHGSFMLVPASIEKYIGFDLGGKGSITEDAYFALLAGEKGIKFDWVEGYIREQSPFCIKDLIKQRRRWICGLLILAFDKKIKFKSRFFLMINLFLWRISWVAVFVTMANITIGGTYFPLELTIVSAILTGGYFAAYAVGVYRNLIDMEFSVTKKMRIYFMTLALVPISAVIEGVAVIYSIVRPVSVFDVVKK